MALFRYVALQPSGKKFTSTIDASDIQEAKAKLCRREILVIQISVLSEKQIGSLLSRKELMHLTKEIARLLRAGLPLFEVLTALEEKYRKQKAHRLLLDLCDQVKSGKPLSESLARHGKTFDVFYIAMVANAEKTGRLTQSLEELALSIEKELRVRGQLISALLYPSLLGTFCLCVFLSLLFFVVPSMRELFEGRPLHPFTTFVFSVSDWACRMKLALGLGFLGLVSFFCLAALYPPWRAKCRLLFIKCPFLRPLFARLALIRFCRSCGSLLEGGVPITAALLQAKRVMHHPPLEKIVGFAEAQMRHGEKLHVAFEGAEDVPSLVSRMLAVAEEGGKLPLMMRQIAEIYEEELEKKLHLLSALAQPALLLLLGVIVGFVLLSVLLPLTDVSSLAN